VRASGRSPAPSDHASQTPIFWAGAPELGKRFPILTISLTRPHLSDPGQMSFALWRSTCDFCPFVNERSFRLSIDIGLQGELGGWPVMPDLQREQFAHDERFHREIVRLSTETRLKHMALHFCKYTGQFATVLQNSDTAALRFRKENPHGTSTFHNTAGAVCVSPYRGENIFAATYIGLHFSSRHNQISRSNKCFRISCRPWLSRASHICGLQRRSF
jgi:hypothetical protein